MKRKLTMIVALAAAFMLVAGVAAAQEADSVAPDRAGRLAAFGDGTADLDVDAGFVRVWLLGDVTITGPADLDVRIDSWIDTPADQGADDRRDGVTIELTGFAGVVAIRGQDYTVDATGLMFVYGIGHGTAALDGEGMWRTRHDRGLWPKVVTLAPTTDLAG